ncbi:hypothetical protein EVAR_16580_1 [Eumeta japonica]|uniref:Uncharacterized protein n=1 Tax=Eumeta variegata TaxID=151549 RepID=A0A4C1U4F4_EUMVA|nr:hypothetical protein EVAR_16580_1 [Eumeta japonica]
MYTRGKTLTLSAAAVGSACRYAAAQRADDRKVGILCLTSLGVTGLAKRRLSTRVASRFTHALRIDRSVAARELRRRQQTNQVIRLIVWSPDIYGHVGDSLRRVHKESLSLPRADGQTDRRRDGRTIGENRRWYLNPHGDSVGYLIIFSRDKRACEPPESKWTPSTMDTRNRRGGISAPAASRVRRGYVTERGVE